MLRFVLGRVLMLLLVALTVSFIGFGLLRLSGDLAAVLAGETATAADIARVAKQYGLDQPLYRQYLDWAGRALRGDLGVSLFTREPVIDLIMARIGVTITLAFSALTTSLIFAVPLGVIAAMRKNTWIDRTVLTISVLGQAIPSFWLGLLLIYLFGVVLRWLPVSGSDSFAHFIMPTLTLSLATMPALMRLTRTGMIEALASDYIRTAWAKGLLPISVLFKHALRNAILPVVSLSAVLLGFLLGGSVIVESVFALNGIGLLAFDSIKRIDFPVVQSILIFLSFCYIFLTLLADLINAKLDPRITL
jgi:ABC-type dipeptide/oligopeptide/nickel transport system permease component